MGNAVTAQAMPIPTTNCQGIALGPIQPSYISIPAAAIEPKSNGVASPNPAVIPLSQRCSQTLRKSSSMPAIHRKTIIAHQAMLFKD